ncbi:endonuclease domain-containing 1 protein-like [Denticeps clupeoides]|uniref:Endonuclease domain-containing 1 protein-like n=1 Tax=Denticeps clupeoides TaxID=299321 RepID=A0AAY3ZVN8_9TELE|nr:endonuclease domain-containing 1 protein-like [Denticeps clupeoides]
MIYLASVVLAVSLSVGLGDVGDFSPCLNLFHRSWPPKVIGGTPICQRYENRFHFATLYGRQRRSPWFSAYIFSPPAGKRPRADWMFEPQLASSRADGNMVPFPPGPVDQNVVESQAVDDDYKNSRFTRGHLNPSLHHTDHRDRVATFTLTNIVPQRPESNDGPWASLEGHVSNVLTKYCQGPSYIVTGIIPYVRDRWLKNRVAIPEYMWSAYCCLNHSRNLPENLTDTFPTFAAIGRNDPNSTEEIVPVDRSKKKQAGYDVRAMPLVELEEHLARRFGTEVSVFHERCA